MKSGWGRLAFYIGHSLNDLRVGGLRSLFAILCIGAGVAAVVSLQTLGAMVENALTTNIQELNRGDLNLSPPRPARTANASPDDGKAAGHLVSAIGGTTVFTDKGYEDLRAWILERDPEAVVTYSHLFIDNISVGQAFILRNERGQDITQIVYGLTIDKNYYPPYSDVRTLDGQRIADVVQAPTDIVISANVAENVGLRVGDEVRIFGTRDENQLFTIRGIIPVEAETVSENFFAAVTTGFYYMDLSAIPLFTTDSNRYPFEIYVQLSNTDFESVSRFGADLQAEFPYVSARSTNDLRERNSDIANAINQLVLVMGLVSLLIGGIGIVNTMLVIVARRTTEIAVLKTIGLQARQVTILFLIEAILLGVIGSLIGIVAGLGLARLLQWFTVNLFEQPLDWVLDYPSIIRGFLLGILVTTVFGFLPTLIAGQVRPGNVLRPSDRVMPRAGVYQTVSTLLITFIVLGTITWTILGDGISPNPSEITSISGIVAVFALTIGIGGAAIISSIPFFRRQTQPEKRTRAYWVLVIIGLMMQTGLQGVLFYSIGTVLEVAINSRLTANGQFLSLGVAIILALFISLRVDRYQRSVPLTFGIVFVGFFSMAIVGGILGAMIGLPLYFLIEPVAPTPWKFIVDLFVNIAFVETAFVVVGMLTGVLWLLVVLASHFPSFGVPDVKISLRALSNNRNRVSTTILALVIGVLALSTVTMLTQSIRRLFERSLIDNAGGNVFMVVGATDDWRQSEQDIETVLSTTDGIKSYSIITYYVGDFVAIRKANGELQGRDELIEIMKTDPRVAGELQEFTSFLDFTLGQINGRSVTAALPNYEFEAGNRQLNVNDTCETQYRTADKCERRVVVTGNLAAQAAQIEAGDTIIMKYTSAESTTPIRLEFKVVGVSTLRPGDVSVDALSPIYAPLDVFQYEADGEPVFLKPILMGGVIDIEEDQIPVLRERVSTELRGTALIEAKLLNNLANDFIERFTILPIVVSILSVITGGIVIANSVALSTMERRREIAIMKAIGLQRERVLGMLLFENSLMGFLGGLIGVGSSVIALIQIWAWIFQGEDISDAVPLEIAVILMLICIGVSIIAAIFTAWGASGEKPLNVLRYE